MNPMTPDGPLLNPQLHGQQIGVGSQTPVALSVVNLFLHMLEPDSTDQLVQTALVALAA